MLPLFVCNFILLTVDLRRYCRVQLCQENSPALNKDSRGVILLGLLGVPRCIFTVVRVRQGEERPRAHLTRFLAYLATWLLPSSLHPCPRSFRKSTRQDLRTPSKGFTNGGLCHAMPCRRSTAAVVGEKGVSRDLLGCFWNNGCLCQEWKVALAASSSSSSRCFHNVHILRVYSSLQRSTQWPQKRQ